MHSASRSSLMVHNMNSDGSLRKSPNMCGAYVEAVYRPLVSVCNGLTNSPWAPPPDSFDYLDPQMYPASRTLPVDSSLYVLANYVVADTGSYGTKTGGSPQLVETWKEFTIRRVMCPTVPWATINYYTNRINGLKAWSPASMTIPGLQFFDPNNGTTVIKNTFPQGTVRFDSAEPIMRTVPSCFDANGNLITDANGLAVTRPIQWWDIVYKFSCARPLPRGRSLTVPPGECRAERRGPISSRGIASGSTVSGFGVVLETRFLARNRLVGTRPGSIPVRRAIDWGFTRSDFNANI